MRPEIPQTLEDEMEYEPPEYPVSLYQLGGYNSKGEFIRAAVREKVQRHKDKYLQDE